MVVVAIAVPGNAPGEQNVLRLVAPSASWLPPSPRGYKMRFWINTMCNSIEIGGARGRERDRVAAGDEEEYVVSVQANDFYLPRFLHTFFGVQPGVFTDFSWFFDFLTRVRRQSLWHFNCLFAQFAQAKPPGLSRVRGIPAWFFKCPSARPGGWR